MPLMSCPPLRPDAPQPTRLASTSATEKPRSASVKVVATPVNPAPTTQTSALTLP